MSTYHSCIHKVRRLCYKGPPRYLRLNVSLSPQGIVVSKALGWIVFTTLHNLRISNSFPDNKSRVDTLDCPPTVYSLTTQHYIHSPLPSRCWSTCNWPVHCVCWAWPHHHSAAPHFNLTWRGLGSGIRSVSSTFLLLLLYGMSFIVVWLSTYFLSDGLPTSE